MPSKYSELSKSANDLLSKDFPSDSIKVEYKTIAKDGASFILNGQRSNATGQIEGDLKHKYSIAERGVELTTILKNNGELQSETVFSDALTKGLKLTFNGGLSNSGLTGLKFGSLFKHDYVATSLDVNFLKGPIVAADVVVGTDGIFAGGEVGYNVHDGGFTKYNGSLAYVAPDYTISLQSQNSFKTFVTSYFHQVNSFLEVGGRVTFNAKTNNTSLEGATKYSLDKDTFVKAKIDDAGKLGVSYTQILRRGVRVSFGGIFDTLKLGENSHKVGLAFAFEG